MPKGRSKVVIAGLRSLGWTDATIQRAAGITGSTFRVIAQGTRELTDRQCKKIEESADRTIGQLVASVVEPEGGAFTEACDASADFERLLRQIRARSKAAKRPKRLRASKHAMGPSTVRAAG